jgi:hypothetical protein
MFAMTLQESSVPHNGEWFTSSFTNGSGACVEVQFRDQGQVAVRDTKDRSGPELLFTAREWDAFVRGAKGGEFDK